MQPLRMEVTMSQLQDLDGIAVRGLWFTHDVFSDQCSSFYPLHEMKLDDLTKSVENEAKIRQEMTEKHLSEMRKAREVWETKMDEILQEEEQKTNKKKQINEKSSTTKIKEEHLLKEPPAVDESIYINVDEEYVSFEDENFREERNQLAPENLNLSEYEVNLREFQIIGGLFKLECFERPSQTEQINFQTFLRLSKFVLQIYSCLSHHKRLF